MTLRESLEKSKRRFVLSLWIAFPLWFLAIFLMSDSPDLAPVLVVAGFVLFGALILFAWYRMKCPACGENLYMLLMSKPWPFGVPAKLKCCPYCTVRLDDEI
jgi:hypothetical protein